MSSVFDRFTTAFLDGWFAHQGGRVKNPYCPTAAFVSHLQWAAGWVARKNAVNSGGDLSLDSEHLQTTYSPPHQDPEATRQVSHEKNIAAVECYR